MNLLVSLKRKVQRKSRLKKEKLFYTYCKNECDILDVGVSEMKTITNTNANQFLLNYKFSDSSYTGLSVVSTDSLQKFFPNKKFIRYDGVKFPFADKSFSWIHCNAVIEHVGDFKAQSFFLKEMLRVSENVFFTTPNKYFPIDSHTMVFFIHWNNKLFKWWREKQTNWISKHQLRLLSLKELRMLINEMGGPNYKIHRTKYFGMTMTYTIIIQQ